MKNLADVLIVGAGPTGSTLAVDLARRGLQVRIIERNAQSFPGSRAKGLQPRSLELLEDIGVLDDVLATGRTYPLLGIHLGWFTLPKRMLKIAAPSSGVPYPNTWLIPQFSTDASLQKRLGDFDVKVEFNTQLTSFAQDDDGVAAMVEGPSGPETIAARYMVGADGGASKVRQLLGIPFTGKTDEADRMVIIDCCIDGLSRNRWHVWPGIGGRFAGACPLPNSDLFQVMIRLQPGEEPQLDDEALNARFRKQTRSKRLRLSGIRWKTVFRPNIRLAESYRSGRVFLAGDAAHVHTPMGAQGLNTGMQDAYNLGWKLGQVLAGARQELLDTYEEERRPLAARVLGLSTEKYEALGKADSASLSRGEDEQQLSITYRTGALARETAGATSKLQTGDRAPDAQLRDDNGMPVRLFELTRGPHFTMVAVGDSAAKDMAAIEWPPAGARLKRISIDSTVNGDINVSDESRSFRSNFGTESGALILIRPDGYIAAIAGRARAQSMAHILALVTPQPTGTASAASL